MTYHNGNSGPEENPVEKIFEDWQENESYPREMLRRTEELTKLGNLLQSFADEVRSRLGVDVCLIADHDYGGNKPRFLAESLGDGVPSRAKDDKHRIDRFAPILGLYTTDAGRRFIVSHNLGRFQNSLTIDDMQVLLHEGRELLAGFEWPWPDRACCFTALAIDGKYGAGALSCVHSSPRVWSAEEGEMIAEFAEKASAELSKFKTLEKRINELEQERNKRNKLEQKLIQEFKEKLPPRQADVLFFLVTEGMENNEIAERLGIKVRTVNEHMEKLFERVGVSNRVQLALWGQKLLDVSDDASTN